MSLGKRMSVWLWLSLCSWVALGTVRVLVIDTPVDRNHTCIRDVYDTDAMSRHRLDDEGKAKTLLQINDESYEGIQSILPKKTPYYLDLIDKAGANGDPMESLGAALKLIFKSTNPFSKFDEDLLGNYIHGTHVSGIITRSAKRSGLRIMSFPLIGVSHPGGRHLDLEGMKKMLEVAKAEKALLVRDLVNVIREENIRVVNLSIGIPRSIGKSLKERANRWTRHWHSKELDVLINDHLMFNVASFDYVVKNCPDALFVFAAGNDGVNLDETKHLDDNLLALIQRPNAVFVANINKQDTLASSSNFGKVRVTIGAPGESILDARAGGGMIHLSGTSMAAPFVSGQLARMFLDHPEYTAEEALEALYHDADRRTYLADQITDGRIVN